MLLLSPRATRYLAYTRILTSRQFVSLLKRKETEPVDISKMEVADRPLIHKNLAYYKDTKTHRVVKQRIKERLIALNSEQIPDGIKFATCCISLPLIVSTLGEPTFYTGLCINLGQPSAVAFFGRNCLRLLQLNISFLGGIHYGFAASNYEVSINGQDLDLTRNQIYYSFTPAFISFSATMPLLFWEPLSQVTLVMSYSTLLACQFMILWANRYFKNKEVAPKWLGRYSLLVILPSLAVTCFLFIMHLQKPELIKRRNDPNRITNLQTALELEDADFLKMSNDLKLGYDNDELRDVEREALNKVNREQNKKRMQQLRED